MRSDKSRKAQKKAEKRLRQRDKRSKHQEPCGEPDVLSLQEYVQAQETAEVKDVYVITLPFNIDKIQPRKAARLIERTKSRWEWFMEAGGRDKHNNTQLGTLNYLPQEIRDMVYLIVLYDILGQFAYNDMEYGWAESPEMKLLERHDMHFRPCYWQWGLPVCKEDRDPLHLSEYVPWWYNARISYDLRQTSRTLRTECDNVFLFYSTFKFGCPKALREFFTRTTIGQQRYIRHVVLEVCTCYCGCDEIGGFKAWMGASEHLPSTLESLQKVHFDMPIPSDVGAGPASVESIEEVVGLLEVMMKQWKRRVPDAEIVLMDHYYSENGKSRLARVLNELD